mgnify:FL=1
MNNNLVVYFSCSGETKKVAEELKSVLNCDIFEIVPETLYTDRDLDWNDKNSRSTIEMGDESCRPRIRNRIDNIDKYDTIYLGFPIWWYTAPRVINTFLESYDFSNKKVVLYCTSGGSSIDKTYNDLKNSYPNIDFIKGSRLYSNSDIDSFANSVK